MALMMNLVWGNPLDAGQIDQMGEVRARRPM